MHNDKSTDKLISEAMRGAPPAPEQLRHNVMAAIREHKPTRMRKIHHFNIFASIAAALIIAVGLYITQEAILPGASKDSMTEQSALVNTFSGGGEVLQDKSQNDAEEADDSSFTYIQPKEDESLEKAFDLQSVPMPTAETEQTTILENARLKADYEAALIVRGELPDALSGIAYTVLEQGVYMFEVTAVEARLIAPEADENGAQIPDEGYVTVLWIPEHENYEE